VDLVNLLVSLIGGAIGGNVAGATMENKSLGMLGNSLAGILGGGIGTTLLQTVGILGHPGSGDITLGGILGNIASGGVGGAVLLIVVSILKSVIQRA
jgi:uncharacterized membrane protein YeaQ/YmgE (transglycosylase-associated protein family)